MKKKLLIGGGIALVLGAMVTANVLMGKNDGGGLGNFASGPTQAVEVQTIEEGELMSSILLTGEVKESNSKTLQAESMIKVDRVLVEVGDAVSEGQPLFEIDMENLEESLAEKELDYEIQNLNLDRLRAVTPNTSVRDVEVSMEMAQLDLAAAERGYADAVADLEKNRKLYESGVISKSEFEGYEDDVTTEANRVESARLSVASSQASLSTARKNSSDSRASSNIDIEIQLMNIKQLDHSISSLEKEIATLEALMQAPMDGVVTSVEVEEGDLPAAFSPIMTIVDLNELEIKVAVREYDLPDLALGQPVTVTGDAIDEEAEVKGEVSFIAPVAIKTVSNGRETSAVEVTIDVTEDRGQLKPGYTAECEIVTSQLTDVIVASYDMLRKNDENEDIVYVLEEDMTLREQVVKLGATSDFDAEIKEGLEKGDQVVLNPAFTLEDGSKVTVIEDEAEEEGE